MHWAPWNKQKTFVLLLVFCVVLVVIERLFNCRPVILMDSERGTECVFPEIDPFKSEIMAMSGLENEKVKCEGYMPDLTYVRGRWLEVNKTRINKSGDFKFCKYREIFSHPSGDMTMTTGNWSDPFASRTPLRDGTQFLFVECENSTSEAISKTYHALIPKSQELAEELSLKLKKRNAVYNPKETLNVVMIGMDGVPRNHFMRAMNKTYKFLMDELGSFDLSMYTQVGINTFPNFITLLTGSYDHEIKTWWGGTMSLDNYKFIWRDFASAGYRTLYTEDQPTLGAFYLGRNGFKSPPTHYNSRPISLAMEEDKFIWKAGRHCLGSEPEITFHYDYVKKYLKTFRDHPLFAFYFQTRISHDNVTTTKMADEHTYEFYKYLHDSGHLNKTLLISFSDHGIRWGPIRSTFNGLIESRAPYAIFTFPKWFLEKYPDLAKNFKTNTGRLTTHFDTHATLQDIIYFKSDRTSPLIPGIHGSSLFQELPKTRVCADISIPFEFCICGQSKIEEISNSSILSQGMVDLVLKSINSITNKTRCANLHLAEIVQVAHIKLTKVNDEDLRVFKIKFVTLPGGALYEGTVTSKKCEDSDLIEYFENLKSGKDNNTLSVTVSQTIDRLNFYRGQADCEDDVSVRAFCYCQDLVIKRKSS